MINKNGVLPVGIVGLIVVALTVAGFFLLNFERTAVNTWALVFLLTSEVALFGGLIAVRLKSEGHAPVFMKAGVSTSLFIYFFTTVVITFTARFFRANVNAYVFLHLATVAFFAIIIISLLAFSRVVNRRNAIDSEKVHTTQAKRGGF